MVHRLLRFQGFRDSTPRPMAGPSKISTHNSLHHRSGSPSKLVKRQVEDFSHRPFCASFFGVPRHFAFRREDFECLT
jgi:hypothetical protein